MNTKAEIPATLPVEFVDRTVYVGGELGFYRAQLGGVVLFDGRLDEARLGRALRHLLDAEPVLGCRLVANAVPPVWQRLDGHRQGGREGDRGLGKRAGVQVA